MTRPWLLRLRGFGVAFEQTVVLASIDLDVPSRGIVNLVASAGEGKSTLLRTLAGLNDAQPALRTWGEAIYLGEPLGAQRPALVQQHARLLTATVRENLVSALPDRSSLTRLEQDALVAGELATLGLERFANDFARSVLDLTIVEQRLLAAARAVLTGAALVMLDEPTARLADEGVYGPDLIGRMAKAVGVIVVTHDQRASRSASAGGSPSSPAAGSSRTRNESSFYDLPASPEARAFVRSGRASVPSPNARPEQLSPSQPPPPPLPAAARAAVAARVGPNGFHWLVPGVIGGLPRPGIVRELETDLEGLQRLRVTRLVTLEEYPSIAEEDLAPFGMRGHHFRIDDMAAPPVEDAVQLFEQLRSWTSDGEVIALHCRAGLGRTGTILAGYLVCEGWTALEALERARSINPRWVQSAEQVCFLQDLELWLSERPDRSGVAPASRLFVLPLRKER
ncbi:MAG: ATP-binding cassette domain-containing protein [Sandaracinaceae bacterium]